MARIPLVREAPGVGTEGIALRIPEGIALRIPEGIA
jgi:hypothetical protein